jgi:hypothetical protein
MNTSAPADRRPHTSVEPYAPLDVPKPVAPDVWIVDGPTIRFQGAMDFPTRMTVIRHPGGGLFIHSPTAISDKLLEGVAELGEPRWIIAPNRLHYWWLPDWRAAFPEAEFCLAPRVKRQAGTHLAFEGRPLQGRTGYPWDDVLDTLPVSGRYMTEVVFFHRPTRTLLLTDLIENFEPDRVGSWVMRLLIRLGRVRAPDGQMPRDMRLTFPRTELRTAVERMIAWNPERIVIAHGRWFRQDGAQELRRAFRWLLR